MQHANPYFYSDIVTQQNRLAMDLISVSWWKFICQVVMISNDLIAVNLSDLHGKWLYAAYFNITFIGTLKVQWFTT